MIYAGPVIGGPLDGQRMAHGTMSIDIPLMDELSFTTDADDGARLVPKVIRYEFKPLYISNQGEQLNVWAPKDATRLDTLRRLLEGYKP